MKSSKKKISSTSSLDNTTGIGQKLYALTEKYDHLFILPIILLAFLMRVLSINYLKSSTYDSKLLFDERLYHIAAVKLLQGERLVNSLYVDFIALVYKLLSTKPIYINYLNIVFGVLTCFIIYLIGKRLAGPVAGLIAGFIAALYKPFMLYSVVYLNASLTVLVMAIVVFLFTELHIGLSKIKLFLLGVAVAALINLRPNAILLALFIPPAIIWNNWGKTSFVKTFATIIVLYCIGMATMITPYLIIKPNPSNQSLKKVSQLSLNFYIGNNLDNPTPYYLPVSFSTSMPHEQPVQFFNEAKRRLGRTDVSADDASRFWIKTVFKTACYQPSAFAIKICQKILAILNGFEASDHYHAGFIGKHIQFFALPFFSYYLLLPLGITGFVLYRRKDIIHWNMILVFIVYSSTLVIFFTNSRYRLPLLIILIPFAGLSVQQMIGFIKKRSVKPVVGFFSLFCGLFTLTIIPFQGVGDLTGHYNTYAILLKNNGQDAQAVHYWETSSNRNGAFSDFANLSLAGYHFNKRDVNKALDYLYKIPDHSFAAAYKYQSMGAILENKGDRDLAIKAYTKSLAVNSSQSEVAFRLNYLKDF